jgi:hypothetical protein
LFGLSDALPDLPAGATGAAGATFAGAVLLDEHDRGRDEHAGYAPVMMPHDHRERKTLQHFAAK